MDRLPERWRWRLAVMAGFGALNLALFNRFFPLSEGWWEAYGYLWNSGLKPYRDFDLAFTPLFTVYNGLLLHLTGGSFYATRLLGVGVFLAALLLMELLLEEFYSPRTAAVATATASLLMMSAPQFIAKDYHTYQLLLVLAALLLHVRLAGAAGAGRGRALVGALALGVTLGLVFGVKQNAGALLIASILASLALSRRERWLELGVAVGAGVLIALLLMLPLVSLSDWRALLTGNDAKGDMGTVLFRFWRDPSIWRVIRRGVKISVALAVAGFAFSPPALWRGVLSERLLALSEKPKVRGAAFAVLWVLVVVERRHVSEGIFAYAVPVTIALLLLVAYRVGRGVLTRSLAADPRVVAIIVPLLGLVYNNTTTAPFDFNGMHIPVAFAVGLALGRVEVWMPSRCWGVAALCCLTVAPTVSAAKLRTPYAWWGHLQPPVSSAVYEPDYPELRGIRVDATYRATLNAIKESVDTWSRSDKDAFFFNLPMLYPLHRKLPPFRTVVHWFDVVSTKAMDDEIRRLEEAPPRLVVAMEPMEEAYRGHKRLKGGARLPQEDFRNLMDRWVASGRFRLVRSMAIPNGAHQDEVITQEIVVQNVGVLQRPLGQVVGAAGTDPGDLMTVGLRRAEAQLQVAPEVTLEAGDVLLVRGLYGRVKALSERVGIARGAPRDWHAVNVYVRSDALAEHSP
jgi:4-amino-4-deoxy-L-arabinose transferase-like glycosyltransferase